MGQGDICLYQDLFLFFPPPHYTELIIHQDHESNICRASCSQTSGKLFSYKWLFLLQVISRLLLLLKKTFFCLKRESKYVPHFCDYLECVFSTSAHTVEVHPCVFLQWKQLIYKHRLHLLLAIIIIIMYLYTSSRLIAKILATNPTWGNKHKRWDDQI